MVMSVEHICLLAGSSDEGSSCNVLHPGCPCRDFVLPALAWDVSYVYLYDPIPTLNPDVVAQYLLITNQITQFHNLTADKGPDDTSVPTIKFTFMAANDMAVEVCKDYQGFLINCNEYSLRRSCGNLTVRPARSAWVPLSRHANAPALQPSPACTGLSALHPPASQAAATAMNAVYTAYNPPDSPLVSKDVVLLRKGRRHSGTVDQISSEALTAVRPAPPLLCTSLVQVLSTSCACGSSRCTAS
jgi:hypothetical protein